MTQGRKGQQHNALRLAEFQQLRLRQIRMRFHLHHRRFDPRGLIERRQIFQHDVGQSNRPALALINEIFHRPPGLQQSHATVINDITRFVSRLHVVSRLKREGRVDQVKVHVTDAQPLATRGERRFDPFWPMIGIPQLRRDEDLLTRDGVRGELRRQ
jgi:hypothetical protein